MSKIKWLVDPAHSQISFKVRHLMISTVTGHFRHFTVEAETATDDFTTTSRIVFTADVDSVDTGNGQRDADLRSNNFFDASKFPTLHFKSTRYEGDDEVAKVYGELTIKDVTRPVVLEIEHGGIVVDPYGQTKAGFTLHTKISRKEFGLSWSATTKAGHVVVGDEVKIQAEIQLVKQEPKTSENISKEHKSRLNSEIL
jgi:polyisoprenoid-binding protein YceI